MSRLPGRSLATVAMMGAALGVALDLPGSGEDGEPRVLSDADRERLAAAQAKRERKAAKRLSQKGPAR